MKLSEDKSQLVSDKCLMFGADPIQDDRHNHLTLENRSYLLGKIFV